MPERHGEQIVETTTEARAAKSVGLSRVLTISTLAVVVIFALLWLYYFT
jgi:hypothetical protein